MGTFRKLSSATFRRGNAAEAVIQVGPRQDFDLTVPFLAFVKFSCIYTKLPQVVCWQPEDQPSAHPLTPKFPSLFYGN